MWCDFRPGAKDEGEFQLGIFVYWNWVRKEATFSLPDRGDNHVWSAPKNIIPRFDLPRAWTPLGAPVAAEPEDYETDLHGYIYPQKHEETGQPPGTKVRRWVTDWEVIE
ncbi:hypothetical protein CHEID_07300 [Corynebacterium heidelbergense]|nr:hypothetical protein CHEID_07300 [Corynebacterium heidelbergense]